jgi:hypothetical protein
MKPLVASVTALAVVVTIGGCSAKRPTPSAGMAKPAESAQVVANSCSAEVPAADLSSWKTVSGDGFTFCVPATWRGRGREWRTAGAMMQWGTGSSPQRKITVPTTVRVVDRSRMPVPSGPPPTDVQQSTQQIGGHSATVWRNRADGKNYVGAQWESPHVWLNGESADTPSADTQMMILRTVRFAAK